MNIFTTYVHIIHKDCKAGTGGDYVLQFIRVVDPRKASYEVEDPEYALVQLAQTAARAEVARLGADQLARERDNLCTAVLDTLSAGAQVANPALWRLLYRSQAWGIDCLRYEVRELRLPTGVQVALQVPSVRHIRIYINKFTPNKIPGKCDNIPF